MNIHQYLTASRRDGLIGANVTCRALAFQLGLPQGWRIVLPFELANARCKLNNSEQCEKRWTAASCAARDGSWVLANDHTYSR